MTLKRIGIVGTGVIAEIHAEAIANHPGLQLTAIADINTSSAKNFANKWKAEHVFESAEELAKSDIIDAVHILTPPDSHAKLSALFLKHNVPTFVEKPVGTTQEDLILLEQATTKSSAQFGVNQNSLFHPAFQKLLGILKSGELGTITSVQIHYAAPLRQLESGQFSHWMFKRPINILLEQAVHPLAQIAQLVGTFDTVQTSTTPPLEIADGKPFYPTTLMNLQGQNASAQLHYSVGATYSRWNIDVLCSDGTVSADIIANRVIKNGRSKWLEATEHFSVGRSAAKQLKSQATGNFLTYAASMIGLKGRSDAFYLGMAASIRNFYALLDGSNEALTVDFPFAKSLVDACLVASDQMIEKEAAPHKSAQRNEVDVVILGGTGFIGRYVVNQCIDKGMTIRVIARNIHNLPAIFQHDLVDVISADMKDADAARTAVSGTKKVINLAHGGGGASPDLVLNAMLGSAEAVFAACAEAGVESLIHMGSIAGLYLGDPNEVITGSTPPDPMPNKRGDYAMAKALTDQRMLELNKGTGPSITILRPGIVVGKGTPATHSGLGVFNNDQHCLGWSSGNVKLPFVMVDDVASATVACLDAENIDGKCYNLVGDVCWTANEYMDALCEETGRPFTYHAQSPRYITSIENLKILIKRIAGKKQAFHNIRDFKSRAMYAPFDCSDVKSALNWQPVADEATFREQAITIHAHSKGQE
ncbi:MAG: NAD-dependent epimerase/dehydratase family protein [Kordiimonas sp.]